MLVTRALAVHSISQYHLEILRALDPIEEVGIVIVPEQFTLQAERDLMHLLNLNGLFHIEVVSFKRLWHRYAKQLGVKTENSLTDLGKKMLLRQLLKERDPSLKLYKGMYKIKGFLDDLTDMFDQWRHQAVTPLLLEALATRQAKVNFKIKLSELFSIYKEYVSLLQTAYHDEATIAKSVMEIMESQTIKELKRTTVVIEGFSSMTMLEIQFLRAMMPSANKMAIRLVDGYDDAVCLRYPKRLYQQLVESFSEYGYSISVVWDMTPVVPCAAHFKDMFEEHEQGLTSGAIQVFEAKDRKEELSFIMLNMVKAHCDQQVPWSDMALLTNDLAEYQGLAKRLFKVFGIPYFIDAKRPALSHIAIDFILTSLRAILVNYKTEDVVKVLKTGFLQVPFDSVCQIENLALSESLRGRGWTDEWSSESLVPFESYRKMLISPLEELKESILKASNASAMAHALRHYLLTVGAIDIIKEMAEQAKRELNYDLAEELAQIHNIIDHVLYQIFVLGEAIQIDKNDFFSLVKLGFENYEIGIIPPIQDYVTMGNIKRTRLAKVNVLYFAGMNDGIIPSRVDLAGIFNDEETHWLIEQGLSKMPSLLNKFDEEVYKTYEHLLRAQGVVTWTYPAFTTEGASLKPSLWTSQLLGSEKPKEIKLLLKDYRLYGLKAPYLEQAFEGLRESLYHSQESLNAEEFTALRGLMQIEDYRQNIEKFLKGVSYLNAPDNLPKSLALKIYGNHLKTSVTRLESFVQCPYQHFTKYALKPTERVMPDLSGLDLGNLFHDVLESMLNYIGSLSKPIVQQDWQSVFEEVFVQMSDKNKRFDFNPKNRYFRERLKVVLNQSLLQIALQLNQSEFLNFKNEMTFGTNLGADAPAVILEGNDDTTLYLEGKIDRVDVVDYEGDRYFSVLDYKSSAKEINLSHVYHGIQLQLMLYLEVACAYSKDSTSSPIKPFGAFYFKVDDPLIDGTKDLEPNDLEAMRLEAFKLAGFCLDHSELLEKADNTLREEGKSKVFPVRLNASGNLAMSSNLISQEGLETAMAYTRVKAVEIAQSIYDGDIGVLPVKDGQQTACDFCKYKSICQFDSKKRQQAYHYPKKHSAEDVLLKMKETLICHGH